MANKNFPYITFENERSLSIKICKDKKTHNQFHHDAGFRGKSYEFETLQEAMGYAQSKPPMLMEWCSFCKPNVKGEERNNEKARLELSKSVEKEGATSFMSDNKEKQDIDRENSSKRMQGHETLDKIRNEKRYPFSEKGVKSANIPQQKGIEVIFYNAQERPRFSSENPSLKEKRGKRIFSIKELEEKWIEGEEIVYIGKRKNLAQSLSAYVRYPIEQSDTHDGGSTLWQLDKSEWSNLEFTYLVSSDADRLIKKLLNEFEEEHGGKLPFAREKR